MSSLGSARALVCAALLATGAHALRAGTVNAPNPFGLLAQKGEGLFTEIDPDGDGKYAPPNESKVKPYERIRAARQLSTPILRVDLDIYPWLHLVNSTVYPDTGDATYSAGYWEDKRIEQLNTYKTYVNAGCRITTNISWGGPLKDYVVEETGNSAPFVGPTDLPYVKPGVAKLMEALRTYTSETGHNGLPELVAVENEEMNLVEVDKNATDANWPTPQTNVANYLHLLNDVTSVIKSGYHVGSINYPATGAVPSIGVTNGGIIERYMEVLIWDWYKNGGGPGNSATFGQAYMDSVIYDAANDQLTTGTNVSGDKKLAIAKDFINGVGGATGYASQAFDYINFHWYGPRENEGAGTALDSVQALNDYQAYLNYKFPGKTVITNEIGSQVSHWADPLTDDAEDAVRAILHQVHDIMGLPYIVWFSGNKDDFYSKPGPHDERYIALTDTEGNLFYDANHVPDHSAPNEEGQAFHDFITDPSRFGFEAWRTHGDTTEHATYTFTGTTDSWLCSHSLGMSVVSDTLKLVTNSSQKHALAYFRTSAGVATELTNVGDALVVDFTLQPSGTIASTDLFYFGLFNSNGATRVTADGHHGAIDDNTKFSPYDGYRVTLRPAASSGADSISFAARAPDSTSTTNQALLCTDTAYPTDNVFGIGGGALGTLSSGTTYACTYSIERSGEHQVLATLTVKNSGGTVLFSNAATFDSDSSVYPDGDLRPFSFDTIAFGTPGDSMAAVFVDTVQLTQKHAATLKAEPVASSSSGEGAIGTSRTAAVDLTAGGFPASVSWYAENLLNSVQGPTTYSATDTDTLSISTSGTYTAVVSNGSGEAFVGPFLLWNAVVVNSISGTSSSVTNSPATVYTLSAGSGGNISGSTDKFYWIKQPALSHQSTPATSQTFIARVSFTTANSGSTAGLMFRGLPSDAQAKNLYAGITRSGSTYSLGAQYRVSGSGSGTTVAFGTPISLGSTGTGWIKIVWAPSGVFTVYGSNSTSTTAPTSWTTIGDTTGSGLSITNNTVGLGLVVAGGTASATATFSGVSVTAP